MCSNFSQSVSQDQGWLVDKLAHGIYVWSIFLRAVVVVVGIMPGRGQKSNRRRIIDLIGKFQLLFIILSCMVHGCSVVNWAALIILNDPCVCLSAYLSTLLPARLTTVRIKAQ